MLKVVIADDEKYICQIMEILVDWQMLDMEIAGMANNGTEALHLVERIRPDILISDIMMPGCNGLELVKKVKQVQPMLEVVIISGYAHFDYAQKALQYGAGDYLLKPVKKTELHSALQKLSKRIITRRESESDMQQLMQKNVSDKLHLQDKQSERDSPRPIRQAKQYMQQHYCEQITQREVSNVVGLNTAYFSVLFKKSEGEGFAQYLIHLRMEETKRLLRETNESVANICCKVGYNDLKHFTHTFEKTTGVKPAAYRKLCG